MQQLVDMVTAAKVLRVHAIGLRWLLDRKGDDAAMTEGLEVLWNEARAIVGFSDDRFTMALELSIDLWPAPYAELVTACAVNGLGV